MAKVLESLEQTKIGNKRSVLQIGNIIKKEFDKTQCEDKAFELLELAYKWQIPQLDEMLKDYKIEDFKWFI